MSKFFYRDIKIIKFCKQCKTEYRPLRFSWQAALGICWKCRRLWFKEIYTRYGKEFEKKPHRKKLRYEVWKKWVVKNIEKRRSIALRSYHKNKMKPGNRSRKHRRTKPDLIKK